MIPDRLELGGECARKASGQRLVAASSERHHRRPDGKWRFQPRHSSAFLIDADPQWQFLRERLRLARDLRHLFGLDDVAGEEDDAAEIELARESAQIRRDGVAGKPCNRELTDVTTNLAKRHASMIIAVRPALGAACGERFT